MLRLWLCGRVAGEFDGVALAMPTSDRAQALIGWLALHRGPQARADVAARLWPDAPESSARASLRTAVWAVRQAWGRAADAVLVSSRNSIGLRAEQLWVDALAPVEIDGELLPGLADDWAEAARAEHRDRRLRLLEDLAAAAEDDGRATEAVRLSRRRCALAPLDEGAHRELLRRLEIAGDRAAAVHEARQFSARLHAELGVRPSPATRAVQTQLRTEAPSVRRTRLFGRAREVTALNEAWRAAADGAGRVVLLTGEAGIGKTSLLAELAHRVGAAGGRSAIAGGVDVGGETPFVAWLELARSLVGTVAPVPPSATWPTELSRLSPDLGARLGRPDAPAAVAAPELERLRVFESVLRLVEWACSDRPLLVALDDAHRADRASLRLTAHIARRLSRLPLLLVLTRRDLPPRAEVDALLADLGRRAIHVTEIDVGPIEDRDVAALAASTQRLDDDAVRRVVAAAEGNPLLAVESTRAMAGGSTAPPPNLRTAVRDTLGRLPPSAQSLARLLAVAGRPLTRAELGALGLPDLPASELAGVDSGLLAPAAGRLGFRHALLREAVYAGLADPTTLHDTVASALEPGDRAEVAHHLALAGRASEAARQWAAAAAYARSVGALTEAADFLSRATECAPDDGQLWLELQEVLAWLGRAEAQERAWQHSLALLDAAELSAAWCRRGRQLRSVVCHPSASFEAYRTAQSLLTALDPPDLHARVLIGLAWGHAVAADATAVDGLLAEAAAHLPAGPDPETAADIAEIRIQGLIRRGRFTECAAIAAAWGAGAALPDPLADRAYSVWINAACALACAGEYAHALELADRAVAGTRNVPVLVVPCLAARAHLLARLGRHDEAAADMRRQREFAERMDAPALAATAAHDAGLVAFAAGRYAQAAQLLAEALAGGAQVSRPTAALVRAEALARSGDPEQAARQLRAAVLEPVAAADQPWALVPRMTGVQGLIAAARGDTELARVRFDEASERWSALLASATQATADGYLATLVDLGRPPVVGLVEPARELARIDVERAALAEAMATR